MVGYQRWCLRKFLLRLWPEMAATRAVMSCMVLPRTVFGRHYNAAAPSKVAERGAGKAKRTPLRVEERHRPARLDPADRADAYTSHFRGGAERLQSIWRDGGDDLEIVATGQDGFD